MSKLAHPDTLLSCEEFAKVLTDLLAHKASSEDRARICQHLSTCKKCLALYADRIDQAMEEGSLLEEEIPSLPFSERIRGVFIPTYHRETLFTKEITVECKDLPQWKPHITLDRRTLESGDD